MKTKKYDNGGRTISEKAAQRKAEKGKGLYVPVDGFEKTKGAYVPYTREGRKEVKETGGTEVYNLKPVRKVMKTGGMVNSNTKISASKVAKGKVGGISKSPKTAVPKAMYGASMKPGMMKKGGMVKKTKIAKRTK